MRKKLYKHCIVSIVIYIRSDDDQEKMEEKRRRDFF